MHLLTNNLENDIVTIKVVTILRFYRRIKMNLNIVCIPGDGIGPEVIAEAKRILNKTAEKYGHNIIYKKRGKKVTSVDKPNVLDTSRLWRRTVEEVAKNYPQVTLEHMIVDNCAMQLVKNPNQFGVILTESRKD